MRSSIKDVAKRANVSHTTVSRILRNVEGFSYSPVTQKKVLSAVKELGYVPNLAAKFIRIKKTNLIGIAVKPENSYGTFRAIEKGSQVIRQYQYNPILIDLEENESENDIFLGRIEYLAGIVCLYGTQEKNAVKQCEVLNLDIPIVTIKSPQTNRDNVRAVVNDSSMGFFQAVTHLHRLGHNNIAYIGHEEPEKGKTRTAMFQSTCKECGVNGKIYPIEVKKINNSFKSGNGIASRIIRDRHITAAICEDDEFAMGLISGLNELGYSVPQNFSVIGFDDLPFAEFTSPKLTTVSVDNAERMTKAVKLLISVIESNNLQIELLPRKITLETKLVVRDTTGKPGSKKNGK